MLGTEAMLEGKRQPECLRVGSDITESNCFVSSSSLSQPQQQEISSSSDGSLRATAGLCEGDKPRLTMGSVWPWSRLGREKRGDLGDR